MANPYQTEMAGYLVCYQNPYATYMCLQRFRSCYPQTTLVLASDKGYDYRNMAAHFGAIYLHETDTLNRSATSFPVERRKEIIRSMLRRHARAVGYVKEPYLMWLEDDVRVNSPVTAQLHADMNGYNPNCLPLETKKLFTKTFHLSDRGTFTRTGHGGTIWKTPFLREGLADTDLHERLLSFYERTTLEWCMDTFLSLLTYARQGSLSSYVGHDDGRDTVNPLLTVQHQFKNYYNQPLPAELQHLVSEVPPPSEQKDA